MEKSKSRYQGVIVNQLFRELFPVQLLSVIVPALGALISGILTGNYLSSDSMVALGFVLPMTIVISAISTIISGGSKVLSGRYIGKGDNEGLERVFSTSIITSIVIGVVLSIIGLAAANPLAVLLGADGELIGLTASYIRGVAIGITPMLLSPLLMAFLQIENEGKSTLVGAAILAAGNLLFGLINIFCFGVGIFGMGLASSVSQYITLIFLALRFRTKKNIMHFNPAVLSGKEALDIIVLGSPAALAIILYALRNIVANKFALKVDGPESVNVLAIINSMEGILVSINNGVGMTTLILASVFVGEKDSASLKSLLKCAYKYAAVLGGLRFLVLLFGGKWLAQLFGASGGVIDKTYTMLMWYGICIWLSIFCISVISIHQSLGRVKYTNILYLFSAFIFPVAWMCLTTGTLKENGIWTCFLVAEILTAVILVVTARIKNKRPIKNFGDILWLDKDLDDGNKISKSLRSMDEVINLSKEITEFCSKNGIDSKRAMMSGLCLEEMAGNVIEHGFTKGKNRNYTVDIYAGIEGEDVVMHIRSNTPEFDPASRLTEQSDDPCKNIGIRMVSKIAKEMSYKPYFGMNVETIRI